MEEDRRDEQPAECPKRGVGEVPGSPEEEALRRRERLEEIVPRDDAEAESLEDRRDRIEHHDARPALPEHRRVEDDRRDEDPEGEEHLDEILHVAEEQIRAAEEERRGES